MQGDNTSSDLGMQREVRWWGPLLAMLTRCPCRHQHYLDHVSRDWHVRNEKP